MQSASCTQVVQNELDILSVVDNDIVKKHINLESESE